MNRFYQRLKYVFGDWFSAFLAWIGFFTCRKIYIEGQSAEVAFSDPKLWIGGLAVSIGWLILYWMNGWYRQVYRKSRLKEFSQILLLTLMGVVVLFFTLILDDTVQTYRNYYTSGLMLFSFHFTLTAIIRLTLTTQVTKQIKNRKIGFNTFLVGANEKAYELYQELVSARESEGHFFQGYVRVNGEESDFNGEIPYLGKYTNLPELIEEHSIEEVIIAIETSEHNKISSILNVLAGTGVVIKIIPDMYDILSGTVKMGNIMGAVLIEVRTDMMPAWQRVLKRWMDVFISALVLLIGMPFFILIGLTVKLSSKGPILFLQERIGWKGKPFKIIKFRTMYTDAEKLGPQLSSKDDPRITPIGKILRKTRLDEFPQFWNVLKGDMSLVGPRPERAYFIEKIKEIAPHYSRLHRVRPGITSWGQIKYGYAENVEQMVERLKFDLLYLENMSLALDMKIFIYTVLIMVQGRGK